MASSNHKYHLFSQVLFVNTTHQLELHIFSVHTGNTEVVPHKVTIEI